MKEKTMGNVTLWMQMSLDGYAAGPNGEFDWPVVGDEVHQYFNEQLAEVDSFLYGRRVYEGMASFWPIAHTIPSSTPRHLEYAEIWKPMPKVVFSRTLDTADWNTRVVSQNVAAEVATLKEQPDSTHVLFGGADVVSTFIREDLVDEYRLFVHPVVLGGGTSVFPDVDARAALTLVESRVFDDAVVALHYRR
jgi:dihydrofolate reductase